MSNDVLSKLTSRKLWLMIAAFLGSTWREYADGSVQYITVGGN